MSVCGFVFIPDRDRLEATFLRWVQHTVGAMVVLRSLWTVDVSIAGDPSVRGFVKCGATWRTC